MSRFGNLNDQYHDDNGDPLSAGTINFYEKGTLTPKTTYSDAALSVANPDPVVLDSAGRQPDVYFDGEARAILKDSGGTTIADMDNLGEPADDSGIGDWSAAATYDIYDLVKGSDDLYYLSVQNSNNGNDPTTPSPSWWMQASIFTEYNSTYTYAQDDLVYRTGTLWRSRQASNSGNTPSVTSAWWQPLNAEAVLSGTQRTSAFTAVKGTMHPIDSSGSAFTVTMPSSPSDGDVVAFRDEGGSLSTNKVTLDRNGSTIMGASDNHELNINNITYVLRYRNGDWRY